jgi:hypothetical protein
VTTTRWPYPFIAAIPSPLWLQVTLDRHDAIECVFADLAQSTVVDREVIRPHPQAGHGGGKDALQHLGVQVVPNVR